ncbi:hypothetical protein BABINDRAFT_160395 [Babjeviella inositovora NRRL Y-12698]|uniref:Uncharacterized protein n=1 Tax=Babjeviella inositovora NRRL Y-12698 TaxID=984486 RepID=A0A1E3QTD6_9ASCO|nr:uncharacterized protein BABINDRAFT_160395 [Babjeviella inositovora NRRL Y-12698]ODQ80965.1 hypothetical protein BABINDRAFT_160395 [Babjeviella inositovora NRRL Y-12698]
MSHWSEIWRYETHEGRTLVLCASCIAPWDLRPASPATLLNIMGYPLTLLECCPWKVVYNNTRSIPLPLIKHKKGDRCSRPMSFQASKCCLVIVDPYSRRKTY